MSGWHVASFEQLSIRLPRRLRVPSEPVAFDRGGEMWKGGGIEVSIAKFIGVSVEPYDPSTSLAVRECTTELDGAFALVREHKVNDVYSVSALFPNSA